MVTSGGQENQRAPALRSSVTMHSDRRAPFEATSRYVSRSRTRVMRGRGTMYESAPYVCEASGRVAHVDQLVRIDDEDLAALDVLS